MKNHPLKLLLATLLLGVLIIPAQAAKAGAQAPGTKNIGLQMYSLRGDIGKNAANIDTIIAAIGKMGYKYVETASYADGKIYGMAPAEFKAKLQAAGLFALSCHTNRRLAANPADTKWEEIWQWWDQCIAAHKAAGMKYIIAPSMPRRPSPAELQSYCDYYNKIGEKCNAAGLRFGYHNHAFEFEHKLPDGVTMYEYMLQHTDPDKVFFEMDVYWTVMGRHSPVDLFKKYPGRFLVLHIKDDRELGESGMVGFDAIFKNLAAAGTQYLIVEVEKYNLPPLDSVRVSLDYLNASPFVKADYSTL
jgi:sugar phosphate isomerase/epimerase